MKKILLGSTALLSAALLSQGARADDQPVKLSISGFFQAGYMVNLKENPSGIGSAGSQFQPDAVGEYGAFKFSGDTKFANGIGAGVFVEAYDFNHGNQGNSKGTTGIEQSWLHITGADFGEIRVGDMTDVRRAETVTAPEFAPQSLFSVNSGDLLLNNGPISSNTTTAPLQGDYAPSVGWFSPTVQGFQFAVSYAPDNTQGNESFGHSGSFEAATNVNSAVTIRDKYSAALTWAGKVYGLSMNASAAITGASNKKDSPTSIADGTEVTPSGQGLSASNPLIWNIGYSVAWGPWAVGADYEQYNNSGGGPVGFAPVGTAGTVNKTIDVGFTYTIGNWTAGAEYSRGSYKGFYGPQMAITGSIAPVLNQAIIGATYLLGPGVTVTGAIQGNDFDNDGAEAKTGLLTSGNGESTSGYDNLAFLVGTNINF
jgi:outer membrane protein OmpU